MRDSMDSHPPEHPDKISVSSVSRRGHLANPLYARLARFKVRIHLLDWTTELDTRFAATDRILVNMSYSLAWNPNYCEDHE
jgi:hypothetical protein